MLRRHDHTIFLVPDPAVLDVVAERFAAAGFLITERDDLGKEKAPTAQKLICFADGSYIEILTIRDSAACARHRFAHLLPLGNGWADYSIACDALEQERARLAEASLPINGPYEHARTLSDGRPWGVRLILAGIGAGFPGLPFLLEDTAGRELRIPVERIQHSNGITGTAGVTIAVRSVAEAEPQFTALFGPGIAAAEGLRFQLCSQWVDVVEPADQASPLARHIAKRGEGVASVTLLQPGAGSRRPLDTGFSPFATIFVADA